MKTFRKPTATATMCNGVFRVPRWWWCLCRPARSLAATWFSASFSGFSVLFLTKLRCQWLLPTLARTAKRAIAQFVSRAGESVHSPRQQPKICDRFVPSFRFGNIRNSRCKLFQGEEHRVFFNHTHTLSCVCCSLIKNAALLDWSAALSFACRYEVLKALLAALKTVLMRLPKIVKTAITTNAINEISKPYSTRVWPSSSWIKQLIMLIILFSNAKSEYRRIRPLGSRRFEIRKINYRFYEATISPLSSNELLDWAFDVHANHNARLQRRNATSWFALLRSAPNKLPS